MACTVKFNQDNKVESVNAPNGKESKLFDSLNSNIFINSKETAWDLQKNVYSDKIEETFKDVKDSKFVYDTNEPKLYYKNNQGLQSESLEEVLMNPNTATVEMGFLNPKNENFIKVGDFETSNNEAEFSGYLLSQVRKGQLSAEKVKRDGEYVFQGKGKFDTTKRINGELVAMDSAILMGGEKININHDGTFTMIPSKDLIIAKNGENDEIIHLDNLEEALLNNQYDNQVDLAIMLMVTKKLKFPAKSSVKVETKKPLKSKEQLVSSLYNFLGRMGFSTMSIEEYQKNYKDRVGKDVSIQALADINKKILAFAKGELTLSNLSEEVAHLAIEAFKDQDTIDSMLAQVVYHPEYAQFASIYEAKYSEKYSGIELQDMVRREILGKILARKFQENFSEDNLTENEVSLHNKLMELWKSLIRRIRGLVSNNHYSAFDKIMDDIVESVTSEDLGLFSEDLLTSTDKIFYSLANSDEKNTVKTLKNMKRVLEDAFKRGFNENLSLSELESLEDEMLSADQLQFATEITAIPRKLIEDVEKELQNNKVTGEFLSDESRNKFAIVQNLEKTLNILKVNIQGIEPSDKYMQNKKIEIEKNISDVLSKLGEVKALKSQDNVGFIKKLITGIGEFVSEKDMKWVLSKVDGFNKDRSMLERYFGIPSNSSNPVVALLPKVVSDMIVTANRRTLEKMNPFVQSLTNDDLNKYQKSILKKDDKEKATYFYEGVVDFHKWTIAKLENEINELVRISGVKPEDAKKAIVEGKVADIEGMTTEKMIEYAEAHSKWKRDNTESRLSQDYLDSVERRHKEANLSENTKNILKRKSEKVRPLRHKGTNSEGKFDVTLLSDIEKSLLEKYEVEFNRNKNAYDPLGELKPGLQLKKVKDLTLEERSTLSFLGEFLDNESIQDREIIVRDFTQPLVAEEAQTAIELQKLDLLTSKEIGESNIDFNADQSFINEIKALENEEKFEEAFEWATLNGNLSFTSEYYDSLAENKSYIDSVEEYLETITEKATQDEVRANLEALKADTRLRNNLLKQVRDKSNPGEIYYEELKDKTRERILELDDSIEKYRKVINLPNSFKSEEGVDYEFGVNNSLINLMIEDGYNPDTEISKFILDKKHLSTKNAHQLDIYKSELTLFFEDKGRKLSTGLNNFINGLEENGVFNDARESGNLTQEVFSKIVLQEYAKSKVASYFKRVTPKGYSSTIARLKNGDIKLSEFISNRDAVVSNNKDTILNLVQINPSYSWRESVAGESIINNKYNDNGYYLQPKLVDDNGNSMYIDEAFLSKYGITKDKVLKDYKGDIKNLQPTRNEKEFDFLKKIIAINEDVIENYGQTGVTNPYKRVQLRKKGIERLGSLFREGSLQNVKDALTDIFKDNVDEMKYGEGLNDTRSEDDENGALTDSTEVKIIPRYFQKDVEDASLLTDSTISATVIAYKQSEIYKARLENVGKIEAIQDHIENQQYEKLGLGKGKRVLKAGESSNTSQMTRQFINGMLYGVQDDTMVKVNILGADIDITQTVRGLTKFVSNLNLKYNLFVDLTSLTTGLVFKKIEALTEENYSNDASKAANSSRIALMTGYLSESGNINKESKMNTLLEGFNIESILERTGNSKYGKAVRLYTKSGFAMSKLANMPVVPDILMSYLHDHRFIESKGKFLNYRSFTTLKKQENPEISLQEIKNEWKGLRGEAFFNYLNLENKVLEPTQKLKDKWGEDTQEKFESLVNDITSKTGKLVSEVDGRMNENDNINLTRNFIGGLTLLHKGWLFLTLGKRFKGRQLNMKTGQMEVGNYIGFVNFVGSLRKSLPKNNYNLIKTFKELKQNGTYEEFSSFKRVALEMGIFVLGLTGALMLLWDDDEDDAYLTTLAKLIYIRTYAEFNSTQAIGLPGLYVEQTKDPIVVNRSLQDATSMVWNLAKMDTDKFYAKFRKLNLYMNRWDKYSDVKRYYKDYMHFNEDNLLFLGGKKQNK